MGKRARETSSCISVSADNMIKEERLSDDRQTSHLEFVAPLSREKTEHTWNDRHSAYLAEKINRHTAADAEIPETFSPMNQDNYVPLGKQLMVRIETLTNHYNCHA